LARWAAIRAEARRARYSDPDTRVYQAPRGIVKVFISWSGEKSKAVATALNGWIPEVLQYVKPFMSDTSIEAGTRPMAVIERELGDTKFGIICVTSDNFEAPWLNFEAGAISKKLGLEETRVAPLLVDLDTNDVNTPLKQFQMRKLDKDGVYDVIRSINTKALDDSEGLDEPRLTSALERCWPALHLKIEDAKAISPSLDVKRTPDEKMDDVLESVLLLTNEVRNLRRRTWQRTRPGDWSRVPAGLSGEGTLGVGWTPSSETTSEAELNHLLTLQFQKEVLLVLMDTPFKLVKINVNDEEEPSEMFIRADAGVPVTTITSMKNQLLELFPGVNVIVGGTQG
jgi:TIR domain